MNKVDPASVQIEWSGKNATRQAFRNRYTPDDELKALALQAVSESTDGINSKELIDTLTNNDEDNNTMITGIIIGELQRLFSKCFVSAEMISWRNDTPTGETMKILEKCIFKIIKKRTFVSQDTQYLIRYKIKYLFDINKLDSTSNEALRLIGFVEYFIDRFTNPKYVIG